MSKLQIPDAPNSITKGTPLKTILGQKAIDQLAFNLHYIDSDFNKTKFIQDALNDIEELGIKDRGTHIANAMKKHLPQNYSEAAQIITQSLTPPLEKTEDNGLATMFYMPHCSYVSQYGVDPKFNNNIDPFDVSMELQYELTQRFTCEFSIRPFIENDQERTMGILYKWMNDPNPHVRRLCSEGTRPRLPWASKLKDLAKDPTPSIKILEKLKDDDNLYVRRSVANHVGDIAKDHLDLALDLCEDWLKVGTKEVNWVIRHAVRNPIKKGNERAIKLRKLAK